MNKLVISVKKWLSSEEFRELLRIADYMGRFPNEGSLFKINIKKAIANGYSLEDIINLLREIGIEIPDYLINEVKNQYIDLTSITIEWSIEYKEILVHIPWTIYHSIKDFVKEELQGRYVNKDSEGITYRIKPYTLYKLRKFVYENGYYINDPSGLTIHKTLPFRLSFTGNLYPFQEEALKAWRENGYRGIIALPTGSGKTVIAIAAITMLNERTLIVTYTKEQMFQWKEMITRFTDINPSYIGFFFSEEKRLSPITITTYQSAHRNIDLLGRYYDLLIIDECHHLPADKFRLIAEHTISTHRMGLSATVVREDGKHVELFPLMGGVVYHKSAAELSQQGYLARYRVYTVKVDLTNEEKKLYQQLYQTYKYFSQGRGFQEVLESARRGDKSAINALKIHSRLRLLIANSESKLREAIKIARKELDKGSKIIIFTQYVDQAKKLSEELGALLLIGEMSSRERKKVLETFKKMSSGILVVTTVGDEGLDIPDANVGIIVSGTGSRRQFIQRLGRLLRPKKGVEAKLYEIVLKGTPDETLARKRKKILETLEDFFEAN